MNRLKSIPLISSKNSPLGERNIELVNGGEDAGRHVGDSADFDRLERLQRFPL